MQFVTIDFETYYSNEYSLTKLTTEEYIRDERFEAIGVAIAIGMGEPVWYAGADIYAGLATVDWENSIVIGQNTRFDAAILEWRYNCRAKVWADIMSMSRGLYPHARSHSLAAQAERAGIGQKGTDVLLAIGKRLADFTPDDLAGYGRYCINDVVLTRDLFLQYIDMGFPKEELQIIDLTIRMFTQPVLILDEAQLKAHLRDVRAARDTLLDTARDSLIMSGDVDAIYHIFTDGKGAILDLLRSDAKLAHILNAMGVTPPRKISLTTGKEAYAFAKSDKEFLALREHPDLAVQAVVEARLGGKSTLEESRTERFISIAQRGPMPIPLQYYAAHSGRWGGTDSINLQNLPTRKDHKYAGRLKHAMLAPPGYVIIDCDSSQIEARVLAWIAGETALVDAFAAKEDVYKMTATFIYQCGMEDVDVQRRAIGKGTVLGCGYGVGPAKLVDYLWTTGKVKVTLEEAQLIVNAYRARYTKIVAFWRRAEEALAAMAQGMRVPLDAQGVFYAEPAGIRMTNGLYLQYPNLRRETVSVVGREPKVAWVYDSKTGPLSIYGGKLTENLCQGIARNIIAWQMNRIAKRYRPILTVHDAIAVIAPKHAADEANAFVTKVMSTSPPWASTLPLACESGVGETYGDC